MLYKILDMLTACDIKFAFLATSQKFDVVDQFEKRIKSRFSHRSTMLYNISLDIFNQQVKAMLNERQ